MDQSERDRTVNVNTVQNANCATTDNRNKKASPRQGSPAPSNSSAGSASSRASSPARTVRFQDQVESGYGASGKGRWQGNQSPQGNNSPRPWAGQRPQGQRPPSPRPPSPGQSGPRFPPPQSERQWTAGQGAPRLRAPAPPNTGNWRPGWRSPTADCNRPPPVQPQSPPAQRRWNQNVDNQQLLSAEVNFPPPRIGCYVCRHFGCHSRLHGSDAVSPQAPPGLRCFVCGRWGCHSSRHPGGVPPLIPSAPDQARSQSQRLAPTAVNQQSNWQRGSTQGERAPLASPRPQSN